MEYIKIFNPMYVKGPSTVPKPLIGFFMLIILNQEVTYLLKDLNS